jgi:hypothetical protein
MEYRINKCIPPALVLSSTPATELNMCEETPLLPHAFSIVGGKLSIESILWSFYKNLQQSL